MRLGGVVDHHQPVRLGDRRKCVEIRGLAIQMRRQNCLGPTRDRRLDLRRVEVVCRRIGLDRHRRCPGHRHRQLRRDIAIARDDHFVARPDPDCPKREVQGVQAVADPDTMLGAAIGRPVALERRNLGAADIPSAIDHPRHRRVNVRLELAGRRAKIEERDQARTIAENSP